MVRTVLYGILLAIVGYAAYLWQHTIKNEPSPSQPKDKARQRYRSRSAKESWVQVYETASSEDAQLIQARLQEEEVECLIYEQGKKDIYGNTLKGIGIAVPKSAVPLAQKVISRMPV